MVVCTIAAENYLHKALHMASGVRSCDLGVRLVICVPERTVHPAVEASGLFDLVLSADDLSYDNVDKFAFRHNVLEFSTAIKPRVMRAALAVFPDEPSVVYLDPDIAVFGPLTEARQVLHTADILVTPHHLVPIDPRHMVPLLRAGGWNLGFLGVRRSKEGENFLLWFTQTLETMCYVDPVTGVFVDQKWMDLAAGLFPVSVLRDPSYNVAHWNLQTRPVVSRDGALDVLGKPLTFFHFSGIDLGRDQRFFKRWAPQGTEVVHRLREDYKRQTECIRLRNDFARRWSYDRYDSGEPIARDARLAVRNEPSLLDACDRPFAESNEYFLSRSQTP